MGYNSVVFILNDAWSEIDLDPTGWWEKTKIELVRMMHATPREYGFGAHANGFSAAWCSHADVSGLLYVGQNQVRVLAEGGYSRNDPDKATLDLLRDAADKLGYKLIRKAAVRGKKA